MLHSLQLSVQYENNETPVCVSIPLDGTTVRYSEVRRKRKCGVLLLVPNPSTTEHKDAYELYFDSEEPRDAFFSDVQRFALSERVPLSVFSKEDAQHTSSLIPLPSFEDVSPSFHKSLLWRKLRQCCIRLDEAAFPDEFQRQISTMNEVVAACAASLPVFAQFPCVDDCVRCVDFLLFRPYPTPETQFDANDVPIPFLDPSWPLLESVYQLLLALLKQFPASLLDALPPSFFQRLAHNFYSRDARERKQVKQTVFRFYADNPDSRQTIKRSLRLALQDYVEGEGTAEGVDEILGFYALVLKGVAVPIHPEHLTFLNRTLFALLRRPHIEVFYFSLEKCMRHLVRKDASLAVGIVDRLLHIWPRGNLNKEIAFLLLLSMLTTNVSESILPRIREPVFKRFCGCLQCENGVIAEKALSLLCEDDLLKRLTDEPTFHTLSSLLKSVEKTSWSDGVKEQCKKVRELMDTTVIVFSPVCCLNPFAAYDSRSIRM